MELKTKYQYTYFIYPFVIEQKNYQNYLYQLLRKKQCTLKWFDRKKDIEIDFYFLPEIKEKLFWSLDLSKEAIKDYEKLDLKMKATLLSQKECNIFDYALEKDIPGKIGEKNGIFFDITKVEIICFHTGICFLLMKTVLDANSNFEDVLNFNYKFRDIQSKTGHPKEFDMIKIQTNKLNNMQNFSEFLQTIAGPNILANKMNIDTNRFFTYSYTCLDAASWNEHTDLTMLEKEFIKYCHIRPETEQINDSISQKENCYQEKYIYYGFSANSTVLFTTENNVNNFTKLLFQYENEQLYHALYRLYQKLYLKKLNYEFVQSKKFENIKEQFLNFAKRDWIYEITTDPKGMILEKYYRKEQYLEDTFLKLKSEYDLLYKEYEIKKTNKSNKWIIAIIAFMLILNIINLGFIFGNQ